MAGPDLSAQPSQVAPHVLLVPGLWSPPMVLGFWSRGLRRQGFTTAAVAYKAVRQDLEQNAALLAAHIAKIPGPVHLVGHSLGGVLIRAYGQRYGWDRVRRVVMVATPNRGIRSAEWFARFPLGTRLMGRSVAMLRAQPLGPRWVGPELGLIAGSRGGLPWPGRGVWDGLVAADEVWLDGAPARLVLPVSHAGMLLSSRVVQAMVAFLQTGRFGS